ncbi:MAG: TetR/AcrR family transcriptional regulator C-terminal domain-containing protein [Brachymonas sp.]
MPRSPSATQASASAALRAPLTRERIESAALALIEELGIEGFSSRKLGQRLGCEAMSLYHHFSSKAVLLDALVDRTLASIPIPARELPPGERIRSLAQAWRAMARQQPRFYLWMGMQRWNSATGVHFLAEVLDCFYAAGLPTEAAARGFHVVGYYVLGATMEETSGDDEATSAVMPLPDSDVQRLYPQVAQAGAYFTADQFDETFERGLSILLRGLGIESTRN